MSAACTSSTNQYIGPAQFPTSQKNFLPNGYWFGWQCRTGRYSFLAAVCKGGFVVHDYVLDFWNIRSHIYVVGDKNPMTLYTVGFGSHGKVEQLGAAGKVNLVPTITRGVVAALCEMVTLHNMKLRKNPDFWPQNHLEPS
jgi:hypothetical protein